MQRAEARRVTLLPGGFARRQQLCNARRLTRILRSVVGSPNQKREKLRPALCFFENRLVEQVLERVLTTDVDDECDCRVDQREIAEVLLGADANVGAALHRLLAKQRGNLQIRGLVRDEVVAEEIAIRLRELAEQPRKAGAV